jgi:ubiquinone/menaquinone biosynthesis C-methylase UbiE
MVHMSKVIPLQDFIWRAENIYTPIYPVIARQIIDRFGITCGLCLDVDSCTGQLGIAMAKLTNLKVILMDIEEEALRIADSKIFENRLGTRVRTMWGDVHNIPFETSSIDLVISRASFHFWDDMKKAFREIHRVLMPGGGAYVGGGFGTQALRTMVECKMKKIDPKWGETNTQRLRDQKRAAFIRAMKALGIKQYEVIEGHSGIWLTMMKDITSDHDNP